MAAMKVRKSRLVLIVLAITSGEAVLGAAEPPLIFMADEEPAMKRAFERARTTLDKFLEIARSGRPGLDGFAVKVGIRDGKETEYFWISDFKQTGDKFSGKIDNTPQRVKNVRANQAYEFSRSQIVDWVYLDRTNKKMVGNFTYCALLSKEPPAQAAAARKKFNLECEA